MATRHDKITKRLIDSLKPLKDEELIVKDTELAGFGYRLQPSGAASYFVKYYMLDGPRRRDARIKVAGKAAPPDEARAKARLLLAEVAMGRNPSARRHEERQALLVAEICDKYLEAARAGLVTTRFRKPKRTSTIAIDEGRVARHIVPLIGKHVAGKLTRPIVQRMADAIAAGKTAGAFKTKARGVARVTGGPGAAARVVELLGGVWSWAEKRGFVSGPNPAHGIDTQRSQAKDRTLNFDELARLGAVLRRQEATQPTAVAALRLIALTGARREEICRLRWREIDCTSPCLRLETSKTGRSMRPIGKAALNLLIALPRGESAFVFPNRDGAGGADMKKNLAALFDAAGLTDTRSHDLRRTFASVAADEGYGDSTIGELLGHARHGVTARHYIRRPDAALIAAADRVADRIAGMMDGGENGGVLSIAKAKVRA
jgi:integrase